MPDGKICYVEIPAADVERSAAFYTAVFGWATRKRGDGAVAFDDTTGAVSGTWVRGRPPMRDAGIVTYVMVDSIEATLKKVAAKGGEIAAPRTAIGPGGDAYALIRDPAGNLVGLYQAPPR
ncbi:MAG TPA: VOC family protein [Gemmatimonadales bacterium]|nr:VOC family protein [Gemmatimonadales bacterium]